MGEHNYLIEGVSCAGKTTVATELERRGHDVVHGDRVPARSGDPRTGRLLDEPDGGWTLQDRHHHHIWDVEATLARLADRRRPVTFFCGGARNSAMFLDRFDGVFVLEIDVETLQRRLDVRPADEFGSAPAERAQRGRRRDPAPRRGWCG